MRKLLSAAMILMMSPLTVIAGPRIFMPETRWDYGDVPQNSTLQHAYWIKNIGDDTLKIVNVKPG
jgi:hypothetical protein